MNIENALYKYMFIIIIKDGTITGHFGFVFKENSVRDTTFIIVTLLFSEKLRVQSVFRQHENKKAAFSNSSGLKTVFKKPRFREGLAWRISVTD